MQIVGLKGGFHTGAVLTGVSDHIHGARLAQACEVEILFEMQSRAPHPPMCFLLNKPCFTLCLTLWAMEESARYTSVWGTYTAVMCGGQTVAELMTVETRQYDQAMSVLPHGRPCFTFWQYYAGNHACLQTRQLMQFPTSPSWPLQEHLLTHICLAIAWCVFNTCG